MARMDTELEKTPTAVRLPKWMGSRLEQAAQNERVTESHIIRWAVEEWLAREGYRTPVRLPKSA